MKKSISLLASSLVFAGSVPPAAYAQAVSAAAMTPAAPVVPVTAPFGLAGQGLSQGLLPAMAPSLGNPGSLTRLPSKPLSLPAPARQPAAALPTPHISPVTAQLRAPVASAAAPVKAAVLSAAAPSAALTSAGPALRAPAGTVPLPAAPGAHGPTGADETPLSAAKTRLSGAQASAAARQDSALQAAGSLKSQGSSSRLQTSLPGFFDQAAAQRPGAEPIAAAQAQGRSVSGLLPAPAPSSDPDAVRAETADFLTRLGFKGFSARIAESLKTPGLTETQKKVLEFNGRRYEVFDAARDLAAEVMAGLAEQGYSPEAMEKTTELAARLLSLQPLSPPVALPAHIARKDKAGIREWIVTVTVQKLSSHMIQLVSDVTGTVFSEQARKAALDDIKAGRSDTPAAREFLARVERIKALSERLLVTAYTDAEMGQTRYGGRALAASLVRFSRRHGRPDLEEDLRAKVSEHGLRLDNFLGDTLLIPDVARGGGFTPVQVKNGDLLGERSGGKEAAEITFAVRPTPGLWFKAWRAKLLGHPIGMLTNRDGGPSVKVGGGFLNSLKVMFWKLMGLVSTAPVLRRGYSHVGMVAVDEADGVSMTWAMDNYPNAKEGGIRKVGILEDFAPQGPFIRLGISRMNADKVWLEWRRQAAGGYQETVYESKDGRWPNTLGGEGFQRLSSIPRDQAPRFLDELNRRAVESLELMLNRFGVGFAYGFTNELWRAYCSSTMMLAHRMGSQFEIQDKPDHWHYLVVILKALGVPGVKDQNTDGRIIWPGSLFVDPKVSLHKSIYYPPFQEVGRIQDPYTVPAYVEMDQALSADLMAYVRLSAGGSITPDPDVISAGIQMYLDSRTDKLRGKRGLRSGANPSTGYSSGLDDLLNGR